ncbi:MAG: hypothetical protein IKK57_03925 [Clostridia bacterium]|nr:hypothetical protein [Clostridia bacterium]
MQKMTCAGCCAPLVPSTTAAFLTCEYCGTTVANPHYNAEAAAQATADVKPDIAALALATLREMGQSQNLSGIDADCFGDPIHGASSARIALSIPDGEQMYFLYDHTILFVAFSDGMALTDTGLYYQCDSSAGKLSWKTFITGAIACTDEEDGQDGELRIGSSIVIAVKSEKESRLARFLVDFHNQVYHQYTGDAAPADWCVAEPAAIAAQQEESGVSGIGTVLGGLGALLGASAVTGKATRSTSGLRTMSNLLQHTPTAHPTSHPTRRQDRTLHTEPPRPLHTQPHHRPPVRPEANVQPGSLKSVRNALNNISNRPAPARPAPSHPAPNRPGQAKSVRDAMGPRGNSDRNALRDFSTSRSQDAQSRRKPGGRR